ncbi:MAG: caspase [Rhodobacteraceae bacterium]|nr:caspase [Paracoccaceae bacterium]MBR9821343.1 caspase [Paracoccaceae bacterium]
MTKSISFGTFRASLAKAAFGATAILVMIAGPALADKRVALLIGNGDYQHTTKLRNPSSDARAISQKLRSMGFETIEGYDLDFLGVRAKAREFAGAARDADIAIFFYAGHGVAVNGVNYIVPVDAMLNDSTAVDFETVPVDMITDQMKFGSGINLVLLDACRDNPLADQLTLATTGSTRSLRVGSGLAEMGLDNAGEGLAIAFATSPGAVAEDGQEEHSPFTAALLRHIGAVNTDFTEVMSRVTGDVYEATEKRQRPWLNASLTGSVVLNKVEQTALAAPAPAAVAQAAPVQPAQGGAGAALEMQKFVFDIARDSGDPADYQAYLDSYPDGAFAPMARNAIERLQGPSEQVAMAQPETTAQATRSVVQTSGPLVLPVTQALMVLPSSEATEQALFLDREARRVLQARLNASGNAVGRPDGSLGPNSRKGIRAWQTSQGLAPTGYMNLAQLDLLASQTEATYPQFLTAASAGSSTGSSRSSGGGNNSKVNNALNSFVNGLGTGIGLRLGK